MSVSDTPPASPSADSAGPASETHSSTSAAAETSPAARRAGVPKAVLFWAALLMLLTGVMGIVAAQRYFDREPGSASEPEAAAPLPSAWLTEFELQERSGQTVGSEDLKGKVWVANFFFSKCPGSCRQQTSLVASLQRDFRDQDDVRFVSITCDPKNDSPSALREYAHGFNAPDKWWFLTGDLLHIRRIGAEFFRLAVSEAGHQDRLAVVDKWGNVRGLFNWHDQLQMDRMEKLIEELRVEQRPPAEVNGQPAKGFEADEAGGEVEADTDMAAGEPA